MSIAALIPILGTVLDKIFPDKEAADAAKLRLFELQQQGDLAEINASTEIAKAQAEVNKAEAQSDGAFKGGWRPAIGYVCAAAMCYSYIIYPLLVFVMAYCKPGVTPPQPVMDDYMWELVSGMLGLGAMRSWEKRKK
ncbi:MAG: holin family protein [Aeromonadaceae bacterium]